MGNNKKKEMKGFGCTRILMIDNGFKLFLNPEFFEVFWSDFLISKNNS